MAASILLWQRVGVALSVATRIRAVKGNLER